MRSQTFISQLLAAAAATTTTANPNLHQSRQETWTVGQTVNTSSGPVTGQPAPENNKVSEYLGIPYATASRFQPPQEYKGSDSTPINGTSYGPACPGAGPLLGSSSDPWVPPDQLSSPAGVKLLGQLLHYPLPQSEDCLSLNIWTERSQSSSKKPVLIFIHGGSFTSGSGSLPAYRGVHFAEANNDDNEGEGEAGGVVLVTLNYRLGVFGNPGNPSLPAANLGLRDQRLAIEWVRDNIASFGGDPERISLFGESAGGESVDLHSLSAASSEWGGDFLAGFITQSGLATASGGIVAADAAAETWERVVEAAGCKDNDSGGDDACMTSLPWEALLAAAEAGTAEGTKGSPFYPIRDGDIIPEDLDPEHLGGTRFTKGSKPMIIGHNDREADLLKYGYEGGDDVPDALYRLFEKAAMDCPARARADSLVDDDASSSSPLLWRYRYFGSFPETELGAEESGSGTFHGGELPVLFGTLGDIIGESDSSGEVEEGSGWEELGDYMRGAWVAFARDPAAGLIGYGDGDGWSPYTKENREIARFGYEGNGDGTNLGDAVTYDGVGVVCGALGLVEDLGGLLG